MRGSMQLACHPPFCVQAVLTSSAVAATGAKMSVAGLTQAFVAALGAAPRLQCSKA